MMKIFFPFAKVNTQQREVWGYASTEARDDQGEIIKRDALTAALRDYMKFANIREMHQLSAVGIATEAAVDDKGLYVGAKIVDGQAWQKVVEGVYKGYSIGGRVTQRDPADYNTITGLVLTEISLVDRPSNPEAVFDFWKAAGGGGMQKSRSMPPVQIWACGVAEHHHRSKAEALKCQESVISAEVAAPAEPPASAALLVKAEAKDGDSARDGEIAYADPGYQSNGQKRYPIDNEAHIRAAWSFINRPINARRYTPAQLDEIKSRIIAAWKNKIDKDGPISAEPKAKHGQDPAPETLTKALWELGHVARIILDLNWLQENLADEAAAEGDASPEPSRLRAIIAELCDFLNQLVVEETDELLNDATSEDEAADADTAELVVRTAGGSGASLIAKLCQGRNRHLQRLAAAIFAKVKHGEADQVLLDLAYCAVVRCAGMDGLLLEANCNLAEARDALKAAGAIAGLDEGGVLSTEADGVSHRVRGRKASFLDNPPAGGPAACLSRIAVGLIDTMISAMSKTQVGHLALMDLAHDCLCKLTGGACCVGTKIAAQHIPEALPHLARAHKHLVAAGADCDAGNLLPNHSLRSGGQAKKAMIGLRATAPASEREERAALIAMLTNLVPRVDALAKRVEDIATTPLPPLTMTKNVAAISKLQDGPSSRSSTDELAAAFAKMSKEEQTLTLIKASHAHPISPPGLATVKDFRGT